MQPRVSIIVTSYNYAPYLRQTIDSALGQTYPHVEVVVVDDGSADASPDIIRSYGSRVIPVFRPNGGQAAAQNSGYRASSGDIVLVLDSDDYLFPNAIAEVVAAWRPGTAKVQFYLDAVDAHGRHLGFRLPNIPMSDDDMRLLVELYGYYPSPPTSGNAYAREVLDRLLPMDEEVWKRGPDGLLNALSALYGQIASVHRPLGAYRIHGRNMYAGTIDVALLRANFRNELDRETAIKLHAAALGRPISAELCLAIPAHVKSRLVSLRLDPANHPVPGDRAGFLALAGMRSVWRFPHLTLAKRLMAGALFPVLAFLPRNLLRVVLEPLFRDTKRPWSALVRRRSTPRLYREGSTASLLLSLSSWLT
jgi:glycosyltransferase involved in cell wall biosynthesis